MVKQRFLKNKEVRELSKKLNEIWNYDLDKKANIYEEEFEDNIKLFFDNKKLIFFEIENNLIPFLKNLDLTSKLKKIKVDDGAIKFILNGADIMKPGIIEYDKNIEENEIIAIINTKETIFAIGKAKCNFEDIEKIKKGKVIKTIHVINDKFWKLSN